MIHYFTPDAMNQVCASTSVPSNRVDSRGGETWFLIGTRWTSYNHAAPPNKSEWACAMDSFQLEVMANPVLIHGTLPGSFPPTSAHPGGVNVLLLDGSVRTVRDQISLPVWRGLASRAGGETANLE